MRLQVRAPLRSLVQPKTRFAVAVCHRRAGKTVAAVQRLVLSALACPLPNPRCAYIAPTYGQAKRVAWDYLKTTAGPVLAATPNESELRVDLVNGARISCYGAENGDSLRGIYLDDVVLDEAADMAPSFWPTVVRPALSDRRGKALFIGTPKGRNEFHALYEGAKLDPTWTALMLRASDTNFVAAEELEAARRDLTPEAYSQEFECSFDAAILGSYFGKEIAEAERTGRITSLPVDAALPVHTAWDLGIGDSTAIWFFQVARDGVRIVEYYEAHGHGLPHYAAELASRGYNYGIEFLPHDAAARELGTGRSLQETLRTLTRRHPRILPAQNVMDGINAARVTLGTCHFDAERCGPGLEALRQYRADYDEKLKTFRDRPKHDWSSHGADAFRYLSMAWRSLAPAKPKPKVEDSWSRAFGKSSGARDTEGWRIA
jgi:phage terminase large subunit